MENHEAFLADHTYTALFWLLLHEITYPTVPFLLIHEILLSFSHYVHVLPDDQNMGVDIVEKDIDGCKVAYFIDKPGIFTAFRIRVDENGTFERKEFMFLFCIDGEAEINGTVIKKGETIFIPCNYGTLTIKGKAEFGGMTYRNL